MDEMRIELLTAHSESVKMNEPATPITIDLRIPGQWSHPRELIQRLPAGWRLSRGDKPIDDGHVLADLNGPRFQAFTQDSPERLAGSPMHNPFGRLKLVSMRDIAETN